MASPSDTTECQSMGTLYVSLKKLCDYAADSSAHHFKSVDEQLNFLWSMHIPSLEKWYLQEFVPSIRSYEQSIGKSATKAEKCKQLAEHYSKNEEFVENAFEYINEVSIKLEMSNNNKFNTMMTSIIRLFVIHLQLKTSATTSLFDQSCIAKSGKI